MSTANTLSSILGRTFVLWVEGEPHERLCLRTIPLIPVLVGEHAHFWVSSLLPRRTHRSRPPQLALLALLVPLFLLAPLLPLLLRALAFWASSVLTLRASWYPLGILGLPRTSYDRLRHFRTSEDFLRHPMTSKDFLRLPRISYYLLGLLMAH